MRLILSLATLAGTCFLLPGLAAAQDVAAGQQIFRSQCSICHSVAPGRNMIGPTLAGLVGRKAGMVPGYHYSAANQSSGIVWNAAALDTYLTSPRQTIPGTKMTYAGVKDPQKRSALIAYLSTLH